MFKTSNGERPKFRSETTIIADQVPATVDTTPITPDDRFELTGEWYYRILSAGCRVLGDAETLAEALEKFNSWPQASIITLGSYIVLNRKAVR